MKKNLIVFLISFIEYENKRNKIIYCNQEESLAIFFDPNINKNSKIDIDKTYNIVDNFKFTKGNNINVNLKWTEESNKVNLLVEILNKFFITFFFI